MCICLFVYLFIYLVSSTYYTVDIMVCYIGGELRLSSETGETASVARGLGL